MNKVDENERGEVYQCARCLQNYCTECHPTEEVDFEIADKTDEIPERARLVEWKGLIVCPFCYNQLVDKKEGKK